jgi:dihydroneopterin aldolase
LRKSLNFTSRVTTNNKQQTTNTNMIKIKQLELYGNHGYYQDEKQVKQKFLLDVSFHLDISIAAATDDLEKTVNYEDIIKICKTIFNEPHNLIETLAVEIARAIKERYPALQQIRVELSKPEVQLGVKLEGVAVCYQID